MIPKIIHYCWFGRGQKSPEILKCMASWKKLLPDYEIMEWNEDNFDINILPYVREAYDAAKYAFVSDYARLTALYAYGGIYLDTDVEIRKSLDGFLDNGLVMGFEVDARLATALIMAEKENRVIRSWMDTYKTRHFSVGGRMDMTPNVAYITEHLKGLGLRMDGTEQRPERDILVCEQKIFSPYSIGESKKKTYPEAYAIHWCDGSWVSGSVRVKHTVVILLKRLLGTERYFALKKKFRHE